MFTIRPLNSRSFSREKLSVWMVLCIGLLVSIFFSFQAKQKIESHEKDQFSFACDQIALKIQERLSAYSLVLRGGAGLFAANETVDRQNWRAYVDTLSASGLIPNLQGVGFAQVIPVDQLATHIARIRSAGFPEYTVWPASERDSYSAIIYLEPFRDRNLRAFGYDMLSEPVRRAAMEQARDTGKAALTGKVELVQETGTDVQAGALMYVPVYRNGAPINTLEQKRAALIGWSYSPYRMKDLMSGILDDWMSERGRSLDLHIFAGPEETHDSLLFGNQDFLTRGAHPLFQQRRILDFNGQLWSLKFDQSTTEPGLNYAGAWYTLLGGFTLSGLLFGLLRAVINLANANRIANKMTAELKTSEASLKESEFRWKFAIEGPGDGLWDWNVPDSTVFFSKRWKEMLGFTEDEISNAQDEWNQRIHSDDQAQVMADLQAHLDGTTPVYSNEHRVRCKDGNWKWVLSRGLVINRDATGKPLRVIGTYTDITQRKAAETVLRHNHDHLEELVLKRTSELAQSRDAAEAANRAKSVFLTTMSHELRTPINGVMGMTDLVLQRATDPQQIDWLNKSQSAAKHLLDILNDILNLSKIEANQLTLEESNFSLAQTIDDSLQMNSAAADVKGLRLSYEIDAGVPGQLCGDALQLKQILLNYIGNAVKFSERGQVTVRAHALEQDKYSVLLKLEVQDTGIGISPKQIRRLFQPFIQADDGLTREYGGTGLGLAISKRIAILMGGDVGVESTVGVGSTFWATMRLKQVANVVKAQPIAAAEAEALISTRYAGHHILVVDDEPISLEITQVNLLAADMVVDTAVNGAEAVVLAKKTPYTVIFMDMQMPEMNGLEATRQIRQLSGYRDTPIIAMTANAYAEDKALCAEAGMNDFLAKPFTPDELLETLLRALNRLDV